MNDLISDDEHFFDENNDDITYGEFTKHLRLDIKRKKKNFANELEFSGEILSKEIENKKTLENLDKSKLIKYILKKEKKKYTAKELYSYSLADVRIIYDEIKSKQFNIIKFITGN